MKYSVNITGFTFEMLLKYLTQSKIRLIVKALVVILSVLQKNKQRASHFPDFRVSCSANCRLVYSLKQKLLQSIVCSFPQKLCLLKGQWNFRPHIKAFKNLVASRQVPASGSPRFGLFTVIIKQSQTVTGPKTLSCQTTLYCSTIRSQKVPLQRTKNIHKTRHDWTCTPLIKNKMGPNSSLSYNQLQK